MSYLQEDIGHGYRKSICRETDNFMINLSSRLVLNLGSKIILVTFSVLYQDSEKVIRKMRVKAYQKENEF